MKNGDYQRVLQLGQSVREKLGLLRVGISQLYDEVVKIENIALQSYLEHEACRRKKNAKSKNL